MSAWTDTLRAASFRGIPFETAGSGFAGGRRLVAHEIPDSDVEVAEDLGRRRRTVSLDAYVMGDDAVNQATRLVQALEQRGPGRLVHPIHGPMTVNVESYQETATWADGRAVSFALSFLELGDLDLSTLDTAGELTAAIEGVNTAADVELLADLITAGFASFVRTDALDAISTVLDLIEAVILGPFAVVEDVSQAVNDLADVRDRIGDLLDAPADLADALRSLMTQIGDVFGLRDLASSAGTVYANPTPATPSKVAAATCQYAVERAQTRAALTTACEVIRDATLPDYDTAVEWRDTIGNLIGLESETTTGDLSELMRRLRTALVEDVTARAAALPRLTTYTPSTVRPTINLAYQLYGDADRANEIVDRNLILHPLFAPARALRILVS